MLDYNSYWTILYFIVLLLCIKNNHKMKIQLSNIIFVYLNKISFGIYSLHWPIVCSLGALVIVSGLKTATS